MFLIFIQKHKLYFSFFKCTKQELLFQIENIYGQIEKNIWKYKKKIVTSLLIEDNFIRNACYYSANTIADA